MNLLKKLWDDEAGVILSAELVVVGTVAVLGVSVGRKRGREFREPGTAGYRLCHSQSGPELRTSGAGKLPSVHGWLELSAAASGTVVDGIRRCTCRFRRNFADNRDC